MTNRLLLSAAVDRMIYGNPQHFSQLDADLVIASTPLIPWWRNLLQIVAQSSSPGASGVAAGAGTIRMDDGQKVTNIDPAERWRVRAGQWKLSRVRNAVMIQQVMADEFDDSRSALLEIGSDGHATSLKISRVHEYPLRLGPVTFFLSRLTWDHWKFPDNGDAS